MTEEKNQGFGGYVPPPQSQDAIIVSLRWEAQQLIHDLYRVLGGYEFIEKEGSVIPQKRNPDAKCLMNDDGIEALVSVITSVVNPVMSLSNLDDTEANELISQTLDAIALNLSMNQAEYDLKAKNMGLVMANMRNIIVAQIKRSVGGHETRWVTKSGIEQNTNVNQNVTENRPGKFFGLGR